MAKIKTTLIDVRVLGLYGDKVFQQNSKMIGKCGGLSKSTKGVSYKKGVSIKKILSDNIVIVLFLVYHLCYYCILTGHLFEQV